MTRPVGQRPMDERSDWTEQDLLTIDEASGRLEQEMQETREALAAADDPEERANLERRLQAMEATKARFAG
jgi:outer membrane murein-binding lipoprotein Lpp